MTDQQKKLLGLSIGVMIGVLVLFLIFRSSGSGGNNIQNILQHSESTGSVSKDDEVYADEETEKKELLSDEDVIENQKQLQKALEDGKTGGTELSPEKEDGSLKFPYVIPGTKLEIQKYESYDGYFLEDGTNDKVQDIPVILLKNRSDVGVEYAHITMMQGDTELVFDVSALPAGGLVVVQEKNRAEYQKGGVTNCTATVAEREDFEKIRDQIRVMENEDGSITVTNLTNEDIPSVRVFYKLYMAEEQAYIGGICYTAKIKDLEANGSQTVTPAHYAVGNTKVVMVRTYDTADE